MQSNRTQYSIVQYNTIHYTLWFCTVIRRGYYDEVVWRNYELSTMGVDAWHVEEVLYHTVPYCTILYCTVYLYAPLYLTLVIWVLIHDN